MLAWDLRAVGLSFSRVMDSMHIIYMWMYNCGDYTKLSHNCILLHTLFALNCFVIFDW